MKNIKRKIIFCIFSSLLLIININLVGAQDSIKIISSPKIFVDKLSVSIDESNKKISGSFTIINQEDKFFNDIFYTVNLYRLVVSNTTTTKQSESIVNLNNYPRDYSYFLKEPLSINPKENKNINFVLDIPPNLLNSNYLIEIQSFLKEGQQLGAAISSPFYLKGNDNFLEIKSGFVVKNNKNYAPLLGIDFQPEQSPQILLEIQNIGKQNVKFYEKIIIFERNLSSEEISKSEKQINAELISGQKDFYKVSLPLISKAGSYLAEIKLYDERNNLLVSGPFYVRFVIRGEGGKILELSPNGQIYSKGEKARISFKVVGSADSVVLNEESGWWQNNLQRKEDTAEIKISIFDLKNRLVGEISKTVVLSNNVFDDAAEIVLNKKINGYLLKAVLFKNKNVFDEKEMKIPPKPLFFSEIFKKYKYWFMIILFLISVLFADLIYRKIKKSKLTTFLIIIVIVFILFGGVFSKTASAYTVYENWSSPYEGQHYRVRETIYAKASPQVVTCSNAPAESYGPWMTLNSSYFCGDSNSSVINCSGIAGGFEGSAYYVGPNTMTLHFFFCSSEINNNSPWCPNGWGGAEYKSSRTIYIDSAIVNIFVYEDRGGGINLNTGISGAQVNCSNGKSGVTSNGSLELEFDKGSYTCTASASGYENGSVSFSVVDGSSTYKKVYIGLKKISAPVGSPSCSLTFTPSTISSPQDVNWRVDYSNDADGNLPYSCTGNLGSGTLTGGTVPNGSFSGTSKNVDPNNLPQTCTITVVNSSGQTSSCSATLNNTSSPPPPPPPPPSTTYYKCINGSCSACTQSDMNDFLTRLLCRYSSLLSCESNCTSPPPPNNRQLQVSLEAVPSKGTAPLSGVDLRAFPTGGAWSGAGTFNFYFYCNNNGDLCNINDTTIKTGEDAFQQFYCDVRGNRVSSNYNNNYNNCWSLSSKPGLCTYNSPGTYYPKVILQSSASLDGKPVAACATVDVSGAGSNGNCSFVANPSTIFIGQFSKLEWKCEGVDDNSCNIDQGIGNVSVSGSTFVRPRKTTTYTLSCQNASAQTTVNVKGFKLREIIPW